MISDRERAPLEDDRKAVDKLTSQLLNGETLDAHQLAVILAGGERELKRMQTKMMREALGDMYELCRDADAKRASEAHKAANKAAFQHERAVSDGRLGGWLSGISRRNKRDGIW